MSFSLCFNQPETSTWGLGGFGQNTNFFKRISHGNQLETRLVIFPILSVYTRDFFLHNVFFFFLCTLARFPLLTISPHSQIADRSDMMDCFCQQQVFGTWETARACAHSSSETQLSTDQSVDDWHCSKASRGIENRKLAAEILDKNQRIDEIPIWGSMPREHTYWQKKYL